VERLDDKGIVDIFVVLVEDAWITPRAANGIGVVVVISVGDRKS
jgi:hypothetical protein